METEPTRGDQPIALDDMQRLEAVVLGRQMDADYRDFVRKTARKLGLDGWVRLESDGTARLLAEGTPEVLDEFEAHLRKGPHDAGTWDVRA